MHTELLIPLFFLVAAAYSTAGFAGGSSYTALLTFFEIPFRSIPPISLGCNLVVSSVGSYNFIRAGHAPWRLLLPFLCVSIPMAFWTGTLPIGKQLFLIILSGSLLCAGINMLLPRRETSAVIPAARRKLWLVGVPVGGFLGALSGLIGIGGGIFLSPLLHVLRWGNSKQIAAASSIFIFCNSLAGLSGRFLKGADLSAFNDPLLIWLPVAVVAGGILGSFFSSRKFSFVFVYRITAILVLYASVNVGLKAFNL